MSNQGPPRLAAGVGLCARRPAGAGVPEGDEVQVGRLLTAGERAVGQGLAELDRRLRGLACGWLRRRFPGLADEDVADVWGEALVGVLEAVRQGRFTADGPLLPWVRQIALARATDHLRRRGARLAALEGLWRTRGSDPAGRGVTPDEEAREVMALTALGVAKLPGQQRLVLRAFAEHYPESACLEALRQEVSRQAGAEQRTNSVKRALQEGRAKPREFLRGKGYDSPFLARR
jgi:DNA-directed RNA polymerase specialized sigma24 family protein